MSARKYYNYDIKYGEIFTPRNEGRSETGIRSGMMTVELLSDEALTADNWSNDLESSIKNQRYLVWTGMFCPLDLFRFEELTRSLAINNLAGSLCFESTRFKRGLNTRREEDAPSANL